MLSELANHLHRIFGTDQSYHAEQQSDGSYKKKPGLVTPNFLKKNLEQAGSIAIYQKNSDTTIKWICFDLDILKINLEDSKIEKAKLELKKSTIQFCKSLDELEIPYLLEVSGNRGFHIWITFSENVSYRIGYDIQQAILESAGLKYNKQLIGIDLFPSNITPTGGVGLGVKIPLSKHKKSGQYSHILESLDAVESYTVQMSLTETLIADQIKILSSHTRTSKSQIESALGLFFDLSHDETFYPTRIKSITVNNSGFTLEELNSHWSAHAPLSALNKKIFEEGSLNNEERKLLVGILGKLKCKTITNFNHHILHKLFEQTKNYSKERSHNAIKALSSFYFPSQEQIEKIAGIKFDTTYSTDELLAICIPKYRNYEDATFELSSNDINIVRSAELNYLFSNDEAQSKLIINELTTYDTDELLSYANEILANPKAAQHYKHFRKEDTKTRTLVTLKTPERIITSTILKQLIYFFDLQPNQNSHGYKPNKGFNGGYIFQPWLYLWIKFVSNISSSIEDSTNSEYYIVKTDIKSFYDKIPHDNLKRMLLGDVNERIDRRLKQISGKPEEAYKNFIKAIFEITETITESNIGLPQGPAYARYLAELYLDNLDTSFETAIQNEELSLYQRYVDDIFFIAPTEEQAKKTLEKLSQELALLGLEINNEKTIISKIKNFTKDFNSYRSQSKYAVDRTSKNFADATDAQQNLAINEFLALVHSDSCQDDLAFIFSHLNGIPSLDQWKNEKATPIIQSGIGRGSLYKHLFSFVLENEKNWNCFNEVEKFTELQSEVLTSAFINLIETSKSDLQSTKTFFESIYPKLSTSEMTNEHLAYLAIKLGTNIDIENVPTASILNCLESIPNPEVLTITELTIPYLNTSLNDIKSLSKFTRTIYPLCANSSITKTDLNSLSSIFYSKLASDEKNEDLSIERPTNIKTAATTLKFYYLLCLFSASNANNSIDLLKSMWMHCNHLYNLHDADSCTHKTPNWFNKINNIELSETKARFIISAIVDGNIDRGFEDNRKIFERFHNLLLIFLTFKQNHLYDQSISEALTTLKDKAVFYRWLIDRENVRLFPNSRPWFEKNVIDNNSIILKNGDKILFRKPTSNFSQNSSPKNEHNDYSEVIVNYDPSLYNSLDESIEELSVTQRLKTLLSIINLCNNSHNLPNIYCNERILNKQTLLPFSDELAKSDFLIVEDQNGNVDSIINNQKNFISCYFRSTTKGPNGDLFKSINEKYLNNLNIDINSLEFLKHASAQLEDFDGMESEFHFDAAMSSALHLSLSDMDPVRRIDKFVDQYHKFNPQLEDRHIYGVTLTLTPSDENPCALLDTVEASLKLIPTHSTPTLALYIDKDIASYKEALQKISIMNDSDRPSFNIDQFEMGHHRVSQTTETIIINGKNYKFSDVELLNVFNNDLQQFESRHAVILNSSEHIYYLRQEHRTYVIAINSSISKIYRAIEQRTKDIIIKNGLNQSYPNGAFNRNSVLTLDKFSQAKDVISTHRKISKKDSEELLINWLKFLPKKFHQPLTTLISAHVVMLEEELKTFTSTIEKLIIDNNSNPFLIKRIGDYNGTHRILYALSNIGRNVEDLSPINIQKSSTKATLITDNIISGSQIASAITYYITGEGYKKAANYFEFNDEQNSQIKSCLTDLVELDICTVLYTKKSIENITTVCRELLNPKLKINVIHGRDIGGDAFFETTKKIGEAEKSAIREQLKDSSFTRELYSHLSTVVSPSYSGSLTEDDINKTNLVARFQSLPKKCFKFLCAGLKHDPDCKPLVRIQELNE